MTSLAGKYCMYTPDVLEHFRRLHTSMYLCVNMFCFTHYAGENRILLRRNQIS